MTSHNWCVSHARTCIRGMGWSSRNKETEKRGNKEGDVRDVWVRGVVWGDVGRWGVVGWGIYARAQPIAQRTEALRRRASHIHTHMHAGTTTRHTRIQ